MQCGLCDGTGKFKEPNNMEAYEKEFDRLDASGTLNMGECRERALKTSGYTIIDCPRCHGKGDE
jgi:hypothetical protein